MGHRRLLAATVAVAFAAAGCGGPTPPRSSRPSGPPLALVVGVDVGAAKATTLQLASFRTCVASAPAPRKDAEPVGVNVTVVPRGRSGKLLLLALVIAVIVAAATSDSSEAAEPPPTDCVPEPVQPRVARVRSGAHDVVVPIDPSGRATVPFALEPGWVVLVDGVPAAPAW